MAAAETEVSSMPEPTSPAGFCRSAVLVRIRKGIGQMVVSQCVAAITPLMLVPLFLRAWGPAGYGRWLSLTAIVSYLALLDFGGQTFIGNLMAKEYAGGNADAMRRRLSEGLSIFTLISSGACCLLMVLAFSLPAFTVLHHEIALTGGDRAVLVLMGGSFLLAIPGGVFATAYRSGGLFSRGLGVANCLKLAGLFGYAATLMAGLGPVAYATVWLGFGVIGTAFVVWDAPRNIPACRHPVISLDAARAGLSHLGGSLYFWMLSLGNAINQQGVIVVLSMIAGPTAVATYATHRTAASLVGYVPNLFQGPVFPELTFVHARQNIRGLRDLMRLTLKSVVLLSTALGLFLWLAAPIAYRIWIGHRMQFDRQLYAILLLQAVLASAWTASGWGLMATNHHRGLARWNFGNALVTIVLAWLFGGRFGLYGVAIASLVGDIVCGLATYPALSARLCGSRARDVYGSIASPMLTVFALAVPFAIAYRSGAGPAGIILASCIAVLLGYLGFRAVFSQEEIGWITNEIQKLWVRQ